MPMSIVVFDDNRDRLAAMRRCLADRFHTYDIQSFTGVAETVAYLRDHLSRVVAISLDHDLELIPGSDGRCVDPGTGREVADFLAERTPQCPVVIHSTNAAAALGMECRLADAGWSVVKVAPYGDLEWVRTTWFPAIRRAILSTATPRSGNGRNGGVKRTSEQVPEEK
jgi:hypothetical protein